MYKQTMNIMKTVGIGIVAGTAVAAIGSQMMKSQHHHHHGHGGKNIRRTAGKAMHTVGDVVDGLEKMLK